MPTEWLGGERRGGWDLPEPVCVQEADHHLLAVRVLASKILTINARGVITSYTWTATLRNAEPKDLSRVPPPSLPPSSSSSAYPASKRRTSAASPPPPPSAPPAVASFLLEAGPHPPLPSNECLTPTAAYTHDPKLAPAMQVFEWIDEDEDEDEGGREGRKEGGREGGMEALAEEEEGGTLLGAQSTTATFPVVVPAHFSSSPSSSSLQATPATPLTSAAATTTTTSSSSSTALPHPLPEPQRPQILKLTLDRDRTPIEHVPRVPPPPPPHSSFSTSSLPPSFHPSIPLHISRSGRFVLGAGAANGEVQLVEIDTETGWVAGEAVMQGHTKRVLCLATAELEESGMELVLTGSEDGTAMLWRLGRLLAKTKKPIVLKRPERVFLGHGAPVVACALSYSLGVTVTASAKEVLIHAIEEPKLVRRVGLAPALERRGLRFRQCLLAEEGFVVVGMEGGGEGGRLQVWTINGNIVAERELSYSSSSSSSSSPSRTPPGAGSQLVRLALLGAARGDGGVLLAAHEDGRIDFYGVIDLELVGSYRLTVPPPLPSSSSSSLPPSLPPHLACVDAGPNAATPVLLACGTTAGSLVVIGLPLLHFLKDLETSNTFTQALLQSFPLKMAQGAVNMAATTIGKARGMASQAKGVAMEALGEAKTIVQEMRKSGLGGVWGLLKGGR